MDGPIVRFDGGSRLSSGSHLLLVAVAVAAASSPTLGLVITVELHVHHTTCEVSSGFLLVCGLTYYSALELLNH